MEVHHCGSDVGKPRGLNVRPEFHSRMKTRASNGNRDLQVFAKALVAKHLTWAFLFKRTIKEVLSCIHSPAEEYAR